ncbi:hypothetical protein PoB_000264100 [Plakobranchus ocellatus]|uniref:Coiled-coil domain-containing protein 181 n=1 Tax=Plakobranchus ocellatus TaxID=259542 RepID=A0AAV3Y1B3_9GAST|nr:hypothetical protein PoB_000264100 [Plakobranchus ocellatus]
MNGSTRPPDPELLGFLQTLVNEGNGSTQERTDSDKENEQARMQLELQQNSSNNLPGGETSSKAEDNSVWDDFYNEEDFQSKPNGSTPSVSSAAAEHKAADADYGRDRFESLERVEEEDEGDDDEGEDSPESREKPQADGRDSPEGAKKKKKRRLFTKVRRPTSAKNTPDLSAPTAAGGSHPDLSTGQGDRGGGVYLHTQQETMSETSGRGGRRLSRRKQVARPRCAGPEPEGDRLQQKYQELQMLMVRPLVEPGQYVQQTRQQLRRLEGLSRQHAQAALADSLLPPARGSATRNRQRKVSHDGQESGARTAFVELSENNTEEGYSTLRTVQVANHGVTRPRSAQHRKFRLSSAQATKGRPLSANQPRTVNGAHNSNVGDRVLDYVANSSNSRGGGRRQVGRKQARSGSNNNTNNTYMSNASNTNGNRNNNTSTNTDTESTNEISTSSSHRNEGGSDNGDNEEDENNQGKNQSRSNSSDSSRSRSGSGSRRGRRTRSSSGSPFRSPRHTETHLKHSNNPALRLWLRRKDKEFRQRRKEDKARQLAEKLDKQEEMRKRDSLFQDSEKKVKEWMTKKRKEANRQAREERRKLKEEEKERQEREAIQQQYNSPFKLSERPQSAPSGSVTHHGRKLFIPIVRPERPIAGGGSNNNAHENATNVAEVNGSPGDRDKEGSEGSEIEPKIPRPPLASKFVYRRPVSGRVRLMKLQQERKADAKRTEVEKMLHEKKLAEEKARKMRMSYDQWLLKKRSEDYAKRQEAAHQRALAKSDPELERIVPEVAKRRIENIKRGKRRVNTGDKTLNKEVNKSFGGGDFNSDGETNDEAPNTQAASYRLEVSGTSFKQRPSSAKASLNPRVSKSPRRPKSAHPRVQSVMDESDPPKNAFKLPFPSENGAPKHVLAKQDKLFAHHITHPESPPGATVHPQRTEDTVTEVLSPTEEHLSQTAEQTQPSGDVICDKKLHVDDNAEPKASFFVTEGNFEQTTNAPDENFNSSFQEPDTMSENNAQLETDKDKNDFKSEEQQVQSEANDESVRVKPAEQGSSQVTQDNDTDDMAEVEANKQPMEQPDIKVIKDEDGDGAHGDEYQEPLELDLGGSGDEKVELNYEEEMEDAQKMAAGDVVEDGNVAQTIEVAENTGLEVRASRHSNKRVSFQEETLVYEPPDLEDLPDDEDFFHGESNGGGEEGNADYLQSDDRTDDYNDDFNEDISGDDDDEDDEAEDERGNYSGDETPRDDEF